MTKDNQGQTEFSSLADIRLRKELLRKDIVAEDERIKDLWHKLFTRPSALSK